MLTETMTYNEVMRHLQKDADAYDRFKEHKVLEWAKIQRRLAPNQRGGRMYKWHSKATNQDAWMVLINTSKKTYGVCNFYPVEGTRRSYYVVSGTHEQIGVMTSHFWKRYAERMHYEHDLEKNMIRYSVHNPYQVALYVNEDETRIVYAVKEGLVLAEFDKERNMHTFRTFVSKAMMRDTQQEAYSKIEELWGEFDRVMGAVTDTHKDKLLEKYTRYISQVTSKIYEKYWNDFE